MSSDQMDVTDVENNKIMGVLAYLLFFLPLIFAKESKFAMYHANQGLLLFLFVVAVNIVGSIIPVIGWFLILPIGNLMAIIFAVLGIINAAKGVAKKLPLIGGFNLIK